MWVVCQSEPSCLTLLMLKKEWADVCPVNAHTILHRSTEVVRAAKRLPAMKVYTSGVYGELVLRSATIWPSGLLFGIGDMFFVQNSGYDAE